MRIRAVVVSLALAWSSSALAGPDPILGGTTTTKGEFPTVVAVYIQNPGALCTGTLIAPQWVMTAAHCVDPNTVGISQDQITANMLVGFDQTSALSGGKTVRAMKTMPNPGYNGGLNDDVGLIELVSPITDRKPVALNRSAADAPSANLKLEMIGYGVNTKGTNNAGTEYVLENKTTFSCTNVGDPGALDANLLCWDQDNGTSGKCEGDSGGPSFATINGVKKQVGITSVGWSTSQTQPTLCDLYGADTRVDHIVAWLDSVIGPSLKCQADGVCNAGCTNPVDPDCPSCTKDSDCTTSGDVCDKGTCVPGPGQPGGLGSTCTTAADCASGSCGTVGTDKKCTQECTPGDATSCPSGFDCLAASSGTGDCWPGANSGGGDSSCSAGGGTGGAAMFLIAIGALFVRRPRRARR